MEKSWEFLAVVVTLVLCTGLAIALTFAPCYSSLCTEEFFPYETRLRIAAYFALLASIGCALLLRASSPVCRCASEKHLTRKQVPLLNRHITAGGLALAFWIVGVTIATTGYWYGAESAFWLAKAAPSACTLLYAHKANAYLTVAAVFAHGAAYYSFVGAYAAAPDSSPRKAAYDIDNPAFTMEQAEQRGPYVSATLGTGTLSDLLMLAIVVTALPVLRRRSYNTFYYVHIILSCLIFISACIHASTDFYFLLRSLILWMLDWALRIFRGDSGLGKTVTATLEAAGHGWYRVTLKPSKGVTSPVEEPADGYASGDEKQLPTPPIQSFYLNIPSVSRVQNHTFTAAKTATNDTGPVFLLQRAPLAGRRKPGTSEGKEWTWKLGRLLGSHGGGDDGQATAAREVTCRVEGPYTPLGTAHETAERVVCIVGGTGFTGAYSLAMWWSRWRARDAGSHFTLLWTMRDRDTASLKEWTEMVGIVDAIPNMTLTLHVSSESGRIDPPQELRRAFALSEGMRKEKRAAWVYVSGPAGFLSDVEDACLQVKQEVTKSNTGGLLAVTRVDYYIAKWET